MLHCHYIISLHSHFSTLSFPYTPSSLRSLAILLPCLYAPLFIPSLVLALPCSYTPLFLRSLIHMLQRYCTPSSFCSLVLTLLFPCVPTLQILFHERFCKRFELMDGPLDCQSIKDLARLENVFGTKKEFRHQLWLSNFILDWKSVENESCNAVVDWTVLEAEVVKIASALTSSLLPRRLTLALPIIGRW